VLISSHRKLLRSKAVVVFLFTKKNERQGARSVQTAIGADLGVHNTTVGSMRSELEDDLLGLRC
jgi:hypothetical protein